MNEQRRENIREQIRELPGFEGYCSPQYDVEWGDRTAVVPLGVLDAAMASLELAIVRSLESGGNEHYQYAAALAKLTECFPE